MIRLGILILIFATVVFFTNFFLSRAGTKLCPNCKGDGIWKGTRGDKNLCKTCNGTGRKE